MLSSSRQDEPTPNSHSMTWSFMRSRNIAETAVSGSLIGGGYNWLKCMPTLAELPIALLMQNPLMLSTADRQTSRIFPGAFTAALLCTLVQLAFNEASIVRIKLASSRLDATRRAPEPRASENGTVFAEPGAAPSWSDSKPDKTKEPAESAFSHVLWLFGLRKLSDEEYQKIINRRSKGES